MRPSERLFKPGYALTLLRLADDELVAAESLGPTKVRPETILFHVQQAVEKALKAVLCHVRKPIPMTPEIRVASGVGARIAAFVSGRAWAHRLGMDIGSRHLRLRGGVALWCLKRNGSAAAPQENVDATASPRNDF